MKGGRDGDGRLIRTCLDSLACSASAPRKIIVLNITTLEIRFCCMNLLSSLAFSGNADEICHSRRQTSSRQRRQSLRQSKPLRLLDPPDQRMAAMHVGKLPVFTPDAHANDTSAGARYDATSGDRAAVIVNA